jgi:hypothetical protein
MKPTHSKTPNNRFTEEQLNQLKTIQSLKGSEYILRAVNSHDELVEALKENLESLALIKDAIKGLTKEGIKLICEEAILNIKNALQNAERG